MECPKPRTDLQGDVSRGRLGLEFEAESGERADDGLVLLRPPKAKLEVGEAEPQIGGSGINPVPNLVRQIGPQYNKKRISAG